MADLPSIVPTVRSGGMGTYATKKFPQLAGNVITRIYAKHANNIPLILEFGGEAGVLDADAASIYQVWDDSRGDRVPVGLSTAILAGMSTNLRNRIPSGMQFYFSPEAPSLTDTVPGRKTVRLMVEGRFPARHVA